MRNIQVLSVFTAVSLSIKEYRISKSPCVGAGIDAGTFLNSKVYGEEFSKVFSGRLSCLATGFVKVYFVIMC